MPDTDKQLQLHGIELNQSKDGFVIVKKFDAIKRRGIVSMNMSSKQLHSVINQAALAGLNPDGVAELVAAVEALVAELTTNNYSCEEGSYEGETIGIRLGINLFNTQTALANVKGGV